MAVGRVGGTKSKIRGQVGDIIYQVKRNDDGTYTQYTYLKGQRTEEVLTPRLQAQRMCMAIVESMMRDLKPVARISFQWAKTKTASLNAFSSNNLRLVQRDCQEHWYGDNVFLFPYRHRTDIQIRDEGGPFMLASGSLSYNLYDVFVDDVDQEFQMQGIVPWTHHFLGLIFNCNVGTDTLDDLLQAHRMTLLDTVCFCVYREYWDYVTDPDDPQVCYKHEYVIATFNQNIPGSTVLTTDVLRSLFNIETKWQAEVFIRWDGKGFGIGHSMDDIGSEERQYYMGAFSISYATGKRLISTSFYTTDDGSDQPWLMDEYPAYNFGSWMGEPTVRPYPSPWGDPIPGRLPVEYQEVEYIGNVNGSRFSIPVGYSVYYMTIELSFFANTFNDGYIIYQGLEKGSIAPRCVASSNRKFLRYRGRVNNAAVKGNSLISMSVGEKYNVRFWAEGSTLKSIINGTAENFNNMGVDVSVDFDETWFFGGSSYRLDGAIYETKFLLTSDGSVLHDFVPCFRRSDGAIGFYDLSANVFYTTEDSQSNFVCGPVVNYLG